jgi:hypothetical protein
VLGDSRRLRRQALVVWLFSWLIVLESLRWKRGGELRIGGKVGEAGKEGRGRVRKGERRREPRRDQDE